MKKVSIISTLVVALGVFATSSAQASDTSNSAATADVVAAIAISNSATLRFGQVSADTSLTTGTVTIGTDGIRVNNGTSAVLSGGTFGNAAFTVTGTGSLGFTITLPADGIVTVSGVGADMAVTGFTSNPSGSSTLSLGTKALAVGATLHLGAAQVPGAYTGNYDVTVAYN